MSYRIASYRIVVRAGGTSLLRRLVVESVSRVPCHLTCGFTVPGVSSEISLKTDRALSRFHIADGSVYTTLRYTRTDRAAGRGGFYARTDQDALYGSLELEPLIQRLMDTPQFQRLHGLKQLGTSDHVYRGCTHTRFEHSVGVAHLAQRFAEGLRRRQPELNITAADVMCVKVAGLLHDLGHGPFSHMWDDVFVKRTGQKWKHEEGSVKMMRYLLAGGGGGPRRAIDLTAYNPPLRAKDVRFIEEMILGTPEEEREGRGKDKEFLYDIVNNTRSGLDVDKLDYFQRDARNSVGDRPVDLDRFIELARVLPAQDKAGNTHRMICYPDKLWVEALGLFRNRMELHSAVYQHKGGKSVELMLVDALVAADPYFTIPGTVDGEHPDGRWRMSEAIHDCKAYTNLKDSVVELVMNDPHPGLARAKEILERLGHRDLYPCVGTTECDFQTLGMTEEETARALVDILRRPPPPRVNGAPPATTNGVLPNGEKGCSEGGESDTEVEEDEEEGEREEEDAGRGEAGAGVGVGGVGEVSGTGGKRGGAGLRNSCIGGGGDGDLRIVCGLSS